MRSSFFNSARFFSCAFLLACTTAGCSGGGQQSTDDGDADGVPGCSDVDLDGYGVGAECDGPDCDDSNPEVWAEDQCATLCGADPQATNCPCDPAATPEPQFCYSAELETLGVGPCRGGLRLCQDGRWGECDGQTVPVEESCDEIDNNCDGAVDEALTNSCGTCGECEELQIGGPDSPFDPENASGLIIDETGGLTLDGSTISLHVIWVANSLDGTISKINTRTREEEARYRTGPLGASSDLWGGTGDNPSRTSVNYLGDAYIANRSFGGEASATKILSEGCPDRDHDGRVETSDGPDDVFDWDEDECIAWNTARGGAGGLGRAIAVEARVGLDGVLQEYAWLGVYSRSEFHEIDGEDGSATGTVVNVGVTPYGAAIDRESNLWCASLAGNVCRFNTLDPDDKEIIVEGGGYNYGITVDAAGNVWTGGSDVSKYNVADGVWEHTPISARGIAADASGWVWTHNDDGRMYRISQEDLTEQTMVQGYGGRGVAVDFDGLVWFINWDRGESDGDISVIDPDAMPESTDEIELCCDTINNSYTYSDMTGYQLRNATNPLGHYDAIFEPCPDNEATLWVGLRWEATTGPGTAVRFQVRAGDTLAELNSGAWVDAGAQPGNEPPVALDEVLGASQDKKYLMVRALLVSESRDGAPVLHTLAAQRACGIGID